MKPTEEEEEVESASDSLSISRAVSCRGRRVYQDSCSVLSLTPGLQPAPLIAVLIRRYLYAHLHPVWRKEGHAQ